MTISQFILYFNALMYSCITSQHDHAVAHTMLIVGAILTVGCQWHHSGQTLYEGIMQQGEGS